MKLNKLLELNAVDILFGVIGSSVSVIILYMLI